MPIAKGPEDGGGGGDPLIAGQVTISGAVAADDITAGNAVAVADNGVGNPEIHLAGTTPSDFSDLFTGFARTSVPIGTNVTIITGRGSVVTPVVEGGGSLTPDLPVYLSMTPGKITQTVPTGSGVQLRRVGFAISSSTIIVEADYKPFFS